MKALILVLLISSVAFAEQLTQTTEEVQAILDGDYTACLAVTNDATFTNALDDTWSVVTGFAECSIGDGVETTTSNITIQVEGHYFMYYSGSVSRDSSQTELYQMAIFKNDAWVIPTHQHIRLSNVTTNQPVVGLAVPTCVSNDVITVRMKCTSGDNETIIIDNLAFGLSRQ